MLYEVMEKRLCRWLGNFPRTEEQVDEFLGVQIMA
jgi:hypothetical protein